MSVRLGTLLVLGFAIGLLAHFPAEPVALAQTPDPTLKREADRLANEGLTLFNQQHWSAARASYAAARDIYRQIGDLREEGRTLSQIGAAWARESNWKAAVEHYELAIPLREAAGDRTGVGLTLQFLGASHMELGEFGTALASLERSWHILEELGEPLNVAHAAFRVGLLRMRLQQPDAAQAAFERALLLYREVGNQTVLVGDTLHNLGLAYAIQGDYERAIELYIEALPFRTTPQSQALTLSNMVIAYRGLGDAERELELTERANAIRAQIGQAPLPLPSARETSEAVALHRRAAEHARQGQYAQALELYAQVIERFDALGNRGQLWEALTDRSIALSGMRRYQEAAQDDERALEVARELGDTARIARSLNNLGANRKALGDYPGALQLMQDSLAMRRVIGNQFLIAQTLHNLGLIHYDLRDFEAAAIAFEEALALRAQLPERSNEASTAFQLGRTLHDLRRYDDAIASYDRALAIYRELGSPDVGVSLNNIGVAYAARGDYARAIEYYRQALDTQPTQVAEALWLTNLFTAYRRLGQMDEAQATMERANPIRVALGQPALTLAPPSTGATTTSNPHHRRGLELARDNRHSEAIEQYDLAIADLESKGDERGLLRVLIDRGWALRLSANTGEARTNNDHALEIARRLEDRGSEATLLNNTGVTYADEQLWSTAIAYYQQAIERSAGLGRSAREAFYHHNIGNAFKNLRQYDEALAAFEMAASLRRQSDDLQNLAGTLKSTGDLLQYNLGQPAQAQPYYEEALALQRQLGRDEGIANNLFDLGRAAYKLRDFVRAVDLLAQAVEAYRATSNPRWEAISLIEQGNAFDALGQLDAARVATEQARDIARDAGILPVEGRALNNLGLLVGKREGFLAALTYYEQALTLRGEGSDRAGVAQTLHNQGNALRQLKKYEEAALALERAVEIRRELGFEVDAQASRSLLLQVYRAQRNFGSAEIATRDVLTRRRATGDRAGEAAALHELGELQRRQGKTADALRSLEPALAIRRELGLHASVATTLLELSQTYRIINQFERASVHAREAVELRRALDNQAGIASALRELGWGLRRLADWTAAEDAFSEALRISESINDRLGQSDALLGLGAVKRRRGDLESAQGYLNQAIAVARKSGDREMQARAHTSLAGLQLGRGNVREARRRVDEATALATQLPGYSPDSLDDLFQLRGQIAVREGNLAAALEAYLEAIRISEQLRISAGVDEYQFARDAESLSRYRGAILAAHGLGDVSTAFALSEQSRARSFLDQMARGQLDLRRGTDGELIAAEDRVRAAIIETQDALVSQRSLPESEQDPELLATLAEQLGSLQREYQDLLLRIRLASPELLSLISVATLDLTEIQSLLSPNVSLLAYYVSPGRTLAFIITRDSLEVVDLPVGADELQRAVEDFRDFASLREVPPSLRRLHDAVLAPVLAHIHTPVLGIIPHGPLHYVPFAALTDGTQYLGDRHTLFYLPSASALRYIQDKRKDSASGATTMGYGQAVGLAPLPFAESEAQRIASIYGADALAGGSATETAVRAHGGARGILHIAAHGQLLPETPLLSRIVLAPDATQDGMLEVHEVYSLTLAQTNLVVLSACETVLGARSDGDDIVGLNRAFIFAGSPAVVASLWSVSDVSTAELMQAFHRNLAAGLPKAEALRAAQAEVRTRFPHPYYWAGFILTGDPG